MVATGADVLNGRAGDDTLIGGAGDDRFVFAYGDGRDVVADFVAGHGSGDVIDLRGCGITSFAELDARMSQVGSDVIIVLDADDRITLQNVSESSLNAQDFAFAFPSAASPFAFASAASPFAEWPQLLEHWWGIGSVLGSSLAGADKIGQSALEVPSGAPVQSCGEGGADPDCFGDADGGVLQHGKALTPNLSEFMLV
jgi:hypothetical protein